MKGSQFWYDRSKKPEFQLRSKEELKKQGYRKSCKICKIPMFEKSLESDPTKKTMVCPNYPYCERQRSFFSDDYYCDYDYYDSDSD
jgi:hypothetical protein